MDKTANVTETEMLVLVVLIQCLLVTLLSETIYEN